MLVYLLGVMPIPDYEIETVLTPVGVDDNRIVMDNCDYKRKKEYVGEYRFIGIGPQVSKYRVLLQWFFAGASNTWLSW
jgi:hypothetical protein